MTALVTADLHLSENPRDQYRFDFMKSLRTLVKKYEVDLLIVVGDLTEAKDRHNADLVNRVVTEFYKFSQLSPVVVSSGNHDWHADAQNPFFSFLRRIAGISWVGTPTSSTDLPIPPLQKLGSSIFLPFAPNPEKDWKGLKLGQYNRIFCHQAFRGAISESGRTLDFGTPVDIFPKGSNVIAGDIHKPQQIGPVTYVGAPYTIDFGDDYEPRVLLLDKGKMRSIPCEGSQKRLIDGASLSDIGKQITKLSKGDILKIRCPLEAGGKKSWQEIKTEIREYAEKHGLIVDGIHPIVTKSKARTVKAKANQSDEEILRSYATHRRLHDRILKTGLWLMEKN